MARYIEDAGIDQPYDVVSMTMEDYIYHNHFTRTDWQGEPVYGSKAADGKERFLKWSYSCGILHIEAWLKNAFGNETDLDGAGKNKAEYKRSLEKLVQDLRNHSGEMFESGYIGHDPMQHEESESAAGSAWAQTSQGTGDGWAQPGSGTGDAWTQSGSGTGDAWTQSGSGTSDAWAQSSQGTSDAWTQTNQGADSGRAQTDAAQPAWSEQHPTYQAPIDFGTTGAGAIGKFLNPTGPGLGIAALLCSFLIPAFGIAFGVIGMRRYKTTGDPDKDKTIKNGRTMCIVALVISILRLVLPFLMGSLIIPLRYFLVD